MVFVSEENITINWIKKSIVNNKYLFTLHADEERRNDSLSVFEVETVLSNGEILEDYPEDRRGHSCLVVGKIKERFVHVVCGRNKSGWLVIITVYIPSTPKWETPIKRGEK